jgi:xyloglucan-specific exo-beta-1,4-glucanase
VAGDLWLVDGAEGASQHGLWHSADGGRTFARIEAVEYGLTLALGAGRGRPGDSPYAVYVYGKMREAPDWGVFTSVDAGRSWQQIAGYPAGLLDRPTCMAASWDRFGTVIAGFSGNSYVIGTLRDR